MPASTPETIIPASARADIEDFELAFARLDWVRAAGCLHLPSQREALQWHVDCCTSAAEAMDRRHHGSDPT